MSGRSAARMRSTGEGLHRGGLPREALRAWLVCPPLPGVAPQRPTRADPTRYPPDRCDPEAIRVSSLRHRVLVHLADYGVVEDPAGRVTRMIAAVLDAKPGRVGTVLARLVDEGLVVRQHNKLSGRTFRAALTDQGRSAVNRQGHNQHATRRRVEAPVVAPRMPQCGPMTTVPFDPEHARERALGGVA